ncbi:hypothetical protein PVK06_041494 [Gossypium arboreum]|uniref:Uncharacterized protein n=1 Tax=Gossypium arboreum TaxID=29729 RepID=A0ABR0N8D2_GOSAR|nr:hypothetical protein PVK06_041494 [Gossypium arboreum]
MMIDIRNLQAFALDILKNDIKFDIFSITKKMEKQVFVLTLVSFALDILKNDIKFDIFSITKKMEKQVFVFTLVFLAKHIYPSFMYFLDYVNYEDSHLVDEISYAAKIPMQAIRNVLWRQKFKDSQEALRMFDIILRQYAAKLECLLVLQYFFQGNQSNFTDIREGVFGCGAYFIS